MNEKENLLISTIQSPDPPAIHPPLRAFPYPFSPLSVCEPTWRPNPLTVADNASWPELLAAVVDWMKITAMRVNKTAPAPTNMISLSCLTKCIFA